MDWEREFKGYETELEPNKRERAYSWMTAIGLQDVDGLKTSDFLRQTAKRNIEGEITQVEAVKLVEDYYDTKEGMSLPADMHEADEAKRCLGAALSDGFARKPRTPYGCHYLVEALYRSGLRAEADKMLLRYWGAMVEKGADTFWEAFMPGDDKLSPYGDCRINSHCHAWSCGPSYFLRHPDFRALTR